MSDALRSRLGRAALAFGFVAAFAYVGQRLYERAAGGAVDPLMVVREAHTSYYWRCANAAWWGGVGLVLVLYGVHAARHAPLTTAAWRWSALGLFAFTSFLALASWRWP
ncbi:MAG: hypothetical protein KF901_28840 [Myxococcales bacterium]|nr:hypothetical protein [Myxococcales bacterium]